MEQRVVFYRVLRIDCSIGFAYQQLDIRIQKCFIRSIGEQERGKPLVLELYMK